MAPRPMMPRCFGPAPLSQRHYSSCPSLLPSSSSSIPGLGGPSTGHDATISPRRTRRQGHGPRVQPARNGLTPAARFSMPQNHPGCCSSSAGDEEDAAVGLSPWLELQREMGSLKADNRLAPRRCCGRGRGGSVGAEVAVAVCDQGSAISSILANSVGESCSEACAGATAGVLAASLSLRLDSPGSAWRGSLGATVGRDTPGTWAGRAACR